MLSKNKRGYDPGAVPVGKRFRKNLADTFLAGQLSAARSASLFTDACAAGATDVGDLANLGEKNANRSLKRKLLKQNCWPYLYWADVRVHNLKKQLPEVVRMPFLLPHEIVFKFFEHGEREALLSAAALLAEDRRLLEAHASACVPCRDPDTVLPLGLWSDAVPCNWDRSQSVDVLALNFPSFSGDWRHVRVPVFSIKKCFQVKKATMDDAVDVLRWSLDCLAMGRAPQRRHDDQPFGKSEKHREQMSHKPLPTALLTQIRGDWKMLKDMFDLPAHNENAGLCFLCPCKPETLREVGLQASWRQQRYTEWDFMERFFREKRHVSPVWRIPGFRLSVVRLDWLHVVDLGVAADCVGNIFWMLQSRMPGGTVDKRVSALFAEICKYYKDTKCADKLSTLTETMIRKNAHSPPKLKAKGAETRRLVPFAAAFSKVVFDSSRPQDQAAITSTSVTSPWTGSHTAARFSAQPPAGLPRSP